MIEQLLNKTLTKVDEDYETIRFHTSCGEVYRMWHRQDCCEYVNVEDVCGDWDDIIGSPILEAYEESNEDTNKYGDLTGWTFYRLSTIKGTVSIRWIGGSNGYYSISVWVEKE